MSDTTAISSGEVVRTIIFNLDAAYLAAFPQAAAVFTNLFKHILATKLMSSVIANPVTITTFDPLSLSPSWWLIGDNVTPSGGLAPLYPDQSGNGNDFGPEPLITAPSYSLGVANGHNAVTGNGTNQKLVGPNDILLISNTEFIIWTVMIVASANVPIGPNYDDCDGVIQQSVSGNWGLGIDPAGPVARFGIYNGVRHQIPVPIPAFGTLFMLETRYSSTDGIFGRVNNGVETALPGALAVFVTGSAADLFVNWNGSKFGAVTIAEQLGCPAAKTPTQRQNMRNYLITKYAL